MGNDSGPKLYPSFLYAILAAIELGWQLGATNIPEPFIKCWINQVNLGATNQTICNNATIPEDQPGNIQSDLNDVTLAWALSTAIYAIGAAIGGLIGGPISDKIGRRYAIFLNAVLGVVVSIILGATRIIGSYAVLIIARTLIGMNTGIASSTAPVYLNEISPEEKKGIFGTSYQVGAVTGILLSQIAGLEWLLGTNDNWPVIFLLGVIPAGLQIILFFIVPESPAWLAVNGKIVEAEKSEISLKGQVVPENKFIILAENAQKEEKVSLIQNIIQLYNDPPVRSAMWNAIAYQIIQQISGINAIMFYSGSIFTSAGIPNEYSGLATVGLGFINVIGSIMAVFLVDKLGRITLLFWSMVIMTISTIVMTILLSFTETSQIIAYLSVVPTLIYVLAFELGAGPIPWMMASEIVPTKYKSGLAALGASSNWFFCFLVGLLFPPLNDLMDQYVFIIFTVLCFGSAVYVKIMGVESKGKSVEEVQEIYRERVGFYSTKTSMGSVQGNSNRSFETIDPSDDEL